MSGTPPLPTRDHFLNHQITVINECSICRGDFDKEEHAPARLCGPDSCNHVFGASCLKDWLQSDMLGANKCPMCRKELFVSLNGPYDSESDNDSDSDDEEMYSDEQMFEAILGNRGQAAEYSDTEVDPMEFDVDVTIEDSEDEDAEITLEEAGSIAMVNLTDDDVTNENSEDEDAEITLEEAGSNAMVDLTNDNEVLEDRLPEREPNFVSETSKYKDEDECRHIYHWGDAFSLTKKLWTNLFNTCSLDCIYEDDVQIQIHEALRHSDPTDHKCTIIYYNEWPKVLEVARDIIRQHYKNRKFVTFEASDPFVWLQRMGDALDWNLCGQLDQLCGTSCGGRYVYGW